MCTPSDSRSLRLRTLPLLALLAACQGDPVTGPAPRDPEPPPPLRPAGTFAGRVAAGSDLAVTGAATARAVPVVGGTGGTIILTTAASPTGTEDVIAIHRRGEASLARGSFPIVAPDAGDGTAFEAGLVRLEGGAVRQLCRASTGTVTITTLEADVARGTLELTLACTAVEGVAAPVTWRVSAEFAARLAADATVPAALRMPIGSWALADVEGNALPATVWSVYDFFNHTFAERVLVTASTLTIGADGRYTLQTEQRYENAGVLYNRRTSIDRGRCTMNASGVLGCASTLVQNRGFSADVTHDRIVARMDAAEVGTIARHAFRRAAP